MDIVIATSPEARGWLKNSGNHTALAPNRFKTKDESLEFIDRLYSLGAESVCIAEDGIRDDTETLRNDGGPWADSIIVTLPTDTDKRHAILNMCSREVFRKVFDNEKVSIWWD